MAEIPIRTGQPGHERTPRHEAQRFVMPLVALADEDGQAQRRSCKPHRTSSLWWWMRATPIG
jgi:hypothetical protein